MGETGVPHMGERGWRRGINKRGGKIPRNACDVYRARPRVAWAWSSVSAVSAGRASPDGSAESEDAARSEVSADSSPPFESRLAFSFLCSSPPSRACPPPASAAELMLVAASVGASVAGSVEARSTIVSRCSSSFCSSTSEAEATASVSRSVGGPSVGGPSVGGASEDSPCPS